MSVIDVSATSGNPAEDRRVAETWMIRGFSGQLITLEPGSKATHLPNWTSAPETQAQILRGVEQGRNLGLLTAKTPALDVEDTPHAPGIEQLIRTRWPGIAMRSRPGSRSRAFLVRLADSGNVVFKGLRVCQIGSPKPIFEVLGAGKQLHIEGVRADCGGVRLEWDKRPAWDELPEVTIGDLTAFGDALVTWLKAHGVNATTSIMEALGGGVVGTGDQCPPDVLKRFLDVFPDDCYEGTDYHQWMNMGHAIWGASAGADWGRELYREFSHRHGGYECDDSYLDKWKSIKGSSLGASWIRDRAAGYAKDEVARISSAWAASEFGAIEDEEEAVRVNPETGQARWLAKEVMRRALQEDKAGRQPGFLKPRTAADYWTFATNIPHPTPLIEGFAMPGVVHPYIGKPGAGKSLLILHQLMSAATGTQARDGKAKTGSAPPHVFALFGEDADFVLGERMAAFGIRHLGLSAGQMPGFHDDRLFEIVANQPLDLLSFDEKTKKIEPRITRGLHRVCDMLEIVLAGGHGLDPTAPIVLVFDMLRHIHTGDDNDRRQIDAVYRVLKAIMVSLEDKGAACGVVFSHHSTKSASRKDDVGFSSAGSVGIEGNARVVTEFRVHENGLVEEIVTKTNYGRTGESKLWRIQEVELRPGVKSAALVPVDGADLKAQEEFLLEQRLDEVQDKLSREKPDDPMLNIGVRSVRGTQSLWDFVQDLPSCMPIRKDEVEALRQAIERSNRFVVGRRKKNGAEGEKIVTNFSPPDK